MKFSLILCTVHRVNEIEQFLISLTKQTYKNFEVILVDQNNDNRLVPIIEKYQKKISILHLNSAIGLSIARNKGLDHTNGNIVGFPDDDCTYPPQLLKNIHTFFQNKTYDFLLGKTIDKSTNEIVAGKPYLLSTKLNCFNFLGSSTTLFISLNSIQKNIINFDEDFGLGAKYNSGEEEDLVFRLLNQGYKGFYDPDIDFVYHPPSDLNYHDFKRAKNRSIGLGAFTIKHIFSLCGFIYMLKYSSLQPFIKIIHSLLTLNRTLLTFHLFRLIGIWDGMLKYSIDTIKVWFKK